MKLASRNNGRPDGELLVVSRDLRRATPVPQIAGTLQYALDNWAAVEPRLQAVYRDLEQGTLNSSVPFDSAQCASPLPRAYQWCDGSTYLSHLELMVQIRNGRMPEWAESDPQLYQGGSDGFLGPRQDIPLRDSSWGLDFEAEIAVVTDHVPMGTEDQQASSHIKLLMLCNDVSLRNLTRAEREKGFGFFQSKPASAFSPVAVTPEELGNAWDGDTIHLPLVTTFNGSEFGRPNAGADRQFGFRWLIRHAAKTRDLGAGTIIGSGTVSNKDRSVGSSCIAERRMIETLQKGKPITDFMKSGDRVRIEMFDSSGASVFGAIDQQVA